MGYCVCVTGLTIEFNVLSNNYVSLTLSIYIIVTHRNKFDENRSQSSCPFDSTSCGLEVVT